MNPGITVAIPVRNGANFLSEALDSVLNQTLSRFELIVSDNNSRDGTEMILQRYAERFANRGVSLRTIRHNRNLTLAENLQCLAREATSTWIKFLCHDDRLRPSALERILELAGQAENGRVGLIGHADVYISPQGDAVGIREVNCPGGRVPGAALARAFALGTNSYPLPAVSNATVRREVFENLGFDTRFDHCDTFLWVRILSRWDYIWIKEVLCDTRIHEGQLTNEIRYNAKSITDHALFWPEFVRIEGKILNLSGSEQIRILLRSPSWAASQAAFVLFTKRSLRGFYLLRALPWRWWPTLAVMLPRALWRHRSQLAPLSRRLPK